MARPFCVIADTRGFGEYESPGQDFHLERVGWDCLFLTLPRFVSSFPRRASLRAEPIDYGDPILAPDYTELKGRVRAIAAGRPIHGLSVSLEPLIMPIAELREELGIPGNRPDEVDGLQDKHLMKALVQAKGLRVPLEFTDFAEIRRALARRIELVVKPRRGYGSRNVRFVRDIEEFDRIFRPDLHPRLLDECIVEERIYGSVFHIDSLVQNGRPLESAVFGYNHPPHIFVAGQPRYAASIDPGPFRDRIVEFNRQCLEALSPGSMVTHLEVYLTPDDDLVFGEIGARPGGGLAGIATSCIIGCNSFAAHTALQVGAELPSMPSGDAAAGWVKIIKSPGLPQAIRWPDREAWPWIVAEQRSIAVGEPIATPLYNGDVSASFAVTGSSRFNVIARLQSCVDSFGVDLASAVSGDVAEDGLRIAASAGRRRA